MWERGSELFGAPGRRLFRRDACSERGEILCAAHVRCLEPDPHSQQTFKHMLPSSTMYLNRSTPRYKFTKRSTAHLVSRCVPGGVPHHETLSWTATAIVDSSCSSSPCPARRRLHISCQGLRLGHAEQLRQREKERDLKNVFPCYYLWLGRK